MVQHDLETGAYLGATWFMGVCFNDPNAGKRQVPWQRPNWRDRLSEGHLVDFMVQPGSGWVEAQVLDTGGGGNALLREVGSSETYEVSTSAAEVQPHFSQRVNWEGAVRAGDYLVAVQGGERLLVRVEDITEADDPRNGANQRLARVGDKWVPFSAGDLSPCDHEAPFADTPWQIHAVPQMGIVLVLFMRVSHI